MNQSIYEELRRLHGLERSVKLAKYTRLGIGGKADWLFMPKTDQQLKAFLSAYPETLAMTVIGRGSNLLIRDGGIRGVTVQLKHAYRDILFDKNSITVGAGVTNKRVSVECLRRGLSGLEFLSGIPGEIGGSIAMNASAFNSSMEDVVEWVEFADRGGKSHTLQKHQIRFHYRKTVFPRSWIITRAGLRGTTCSKTQVARRLDRLKRKRIALQPTRGRTAGSTFMNPYNEHARLLIANAGCAGLMMGDAVVSQLNPNFFFNVGRASSRDFEKLISVVQHNVVRHTGKRLELEIRCLGDELNR